MTRVYKDPDAEIRSVAGRSMAIIGYGNQGRAQALNMRDAGLDRIVVGSTKPPADHPASRDGFEVVPIAEAARRADILFLLVPDEVMPAIYEAEIEPALGPGKTLNFASGYNITFGLIQPPPSVDVIMLAPRMIGDGVRNLHLSGEGYPAFVAVHQDASGQARATVLGLAKAIGATRKGAIEVTFRDEAMLDLLAEQAIWPMILAVLTEAHQFQVEKGHPKEASLVELYLSQEPAYMFEKMAKVGLFHQLPLHSHTSQYGQLSRHEALDKTFIRQTLEEAYAYIARGAFAEEWKREQAAGLPTYQRLLKSALNSEISRLEKPFLPGQANGQANSMSIVDHVVTEQQVRAALEQGAGHLRVPPGAVITPSAMDLARDHHLEIVRGESPPT